MDLVNSQDKFTFIPREIQSFSSNVCYQNYEGRKYVFSVLNDNDVVAKSHEELREVISFLSNEYARACSSIEKIKSLSTIKK